MMNKKSGFTLIELMVVMLLMVILLGFGSNAFTSSLRRGRDSTRKANLRAITNALEMYYNDNGRYPAGDAAGEIIGCKGGTGLTPTPAPTFCTANSAWKDSNETIYMQSLPTDPISSQMYYYRSPATDQYQIYARLENTEDASIITPAAPVPSCGSGPCNWGLSSQTISP